MKLPAHYAWLAAEGAPRMLVEALKLHGTLEAPGLSNNPQILNWADEVAMAFPSPYNRWAADFYKHDSIAWCGLGMAIAAARADRAPPNKYLSALAWAEGGPGWVKVPIAGAMLGDVLIFKRNGGGHVALNVGEDETHFHMLGANQDDAFNIRRKAKAQCVGVIRPAYINRPANVRKVRLSSTGIVSGSEA
jgi:uncharacterized protein (TIGR02594 family)